MPRRVLEIAFLVAVVAFFVLYLRGIDWEQFAQLHIDWRNLVIATIFALIFRYWGVMIWRFILSDLGATGLPNFTTMAYVYAKAWMGRYIPGTVTWIAGKVYMASAHGISKSRLAVSSLLEGGMQVIAVMVVALLLLGFDSRTSVIPIDYKIVMVIFAALLLIALSPFAFNRIMRIAYYAVKKSDPGNELLINEKAVLRAFILYAIGGFILGMSEFYISRTIAPSISWHNLLFIIGAFNLAGALGVIAIGVPSGLGVRDGVLLVLLSVILPKELALAITVTSRLWSAFADILFFGLATLVQQILKRQQAKTLQRTH